MRRALDGIDTVVHFAAAVGVGQSMYEIERYTSINAIGAAVVLEAVLERRDAIRKLLVASSMSIYGEGQYRNPQTGQSGLAPGIRPETPFRGLFREYPFTVLAEGDGWSVSGLCGRIWTLKRDYPRLAGPDEFCAWEEPGTVRVVIANWVEGAASGDAALVSESRVKPVDRGASMRLRALWAVVGGLERLIGGEALRIAVRRAEG